MAQMAEKKCVTKMATIMKEKNAVLKHNSLL
jgi:hypothetical protein